MLSLQQGGAHVACSSLPGTLSPSLRSTQERLAPRCCANVQDRRCPGPAIPQQPRRHPGPRSPCVWRRPGLGARSGPSVQEAGRGGALRGGRWKSPQAQKPNGTAGWGQRSHWRRPHFVPQTTRREETEPDGAKQPGPPPPKPAPLPSRCRGAGLRSCSRPVPCPQPRSACPREVEEGAWGGAPSAHPGASAPFQRPAAWPGWVWLGQGQRWDCTHEKSHHLHFLQGRAAGRRTHSAGSHAFLPGSQAWPRAAGVEGRPGAGAVTRGVEVSALSGSLSAPTLSRDRRRHRAPGRPGPDRPAPAVLTLGLARGPLAGPRAEDRAPERPRSPDGARCPCPGANRSRQHGGPCWRSLRQENSPQPPTCTPLVPSRVRVAPGDFPQSPLQEPATQSSTSRELGTPRSPPSSRSRGRSQVRGGRGRPFRREGDRGTQEPSSAQTSRAHPTPQRHPADPDRQLWQPVFSGATCPIAYMPLRSVPSLGSLAPSPGCRENLGAGLLVLTTFLLWARAPARHLVNRGRAAVSCAAPPHRSPGDGASARLPRQSETRPLGLRQTSRSLNARSQRGRLPLWAPPEPAQPSAGRAGRRRAPGSRGTGSLHLRPLSTSPGPGHSGRPGNVGRTGPRTWSSPANCRLLRGHTPF